MKLFLPVGLSHVFHNPFLVSSAFLYMQNTRNCYFSRGQRGQFWALTLLTDKISMNIQACCSTVMHDEKYCAISVPQYL